MLLPCDTAVLHFSAVREYHPYAFHRHYPLWTEKCMTASKWRSLLGKRKDKG